jgi:thiopeptide-type bacteriocin biosynthesis protein
VQPERQIPVTDLLISVLGEHGAVDRWFFIRYGDPDWHLRVRFHGQPSRLHGEVLPSLEAATAPLIDDGRIWRVQLDTYEGEVERYGGAEGTELAEQLFHVDSESALKLAALVSDDARGNVRWRLAFLGMDLLLTDLNFDPDTRLSVTRQAREMFAAEFRADAVLRHQLGTRFRLERSALEALLGSAAGADSLFSAGLDILRHRSVRLETIAGELRSRARAGRLTTPLPELAVSFLHMHANRLLRSAHRAQELVLYDFLSRLYESQTSRGTSRSSGTMRLTKSPEHRPSGSPEGRE